MKLHNCGCLRHLREMNRDFLQHFLDAPRNEWYVCENYLFANFYGHAVESFGLHLSHATAIALMTFHVVTQLLFFCDFLFFHPTFSLILCFFLTWQILGEREQIPTPTHTWSTIKNEILSDPLARSINQSSWTWKMKKENYSEDENEWQQKSEREFPFCAVMKKKKAISWSWLIKGKLSLFVTTMRKCIAMVEINLRD